MTSKIWSIPRGLIASDVQGLLAVRAKERGVSLELVSHGEIPVQVNSDPTKLRQILTNLVGNALKFTEQGGVTSKPINKQELFALIRASVAVDK